MSGITAGIREAVAIFGDASARWGARNEAMSREYALLKPHFCAISEALCALRERGVEPTEVLVSPEVGARIEEVTGDKLGQGDPPARVFGCPIKVAEGLGETVGAR